MRRHSDDGSSAGGRRSTGTGRSVHARSARAGSGTSGRRKPDLTIEDLLGAIDFNGVITDFNAVPVDALGVESSGGGGGGGEGSLMDFSEGENTFLLPLM